MQQDQEQEQEHHAQFSRLDWKRGTMSAMQASTARSEGAKRPPSPQEQVQQDQEQEQERQFPGRPRGAYIQYLTKKLKLCRSLKPLWMGGLRARRGRARARGAAILCSRRRCHAARGPPQKAGRPRRARCTQSEVQMRV